MNHSLHWKESPVFIARPGDCRLHRIVVFKRMVDSTWVVAVQDRNSTSVNWRTFEVFRYDLHKQALMFAKLLLKAL